MKTRRESCAETAMEDSCENEDGKAVQKWRRKTRVKTRMGSRTKTATEDSCENEEGKPCGNGDGRLV